MHCIVSARKVASFVPAPAVVIAAMLLSACATSNDGFYIHSPERDKQGQAVKEAWSKVDLKSQVDVPRQNLTKTLAEQLATEEEIWSKRRAIVAGQMAGDWTVAKFQSKAAEGLQRVLGKVAPPDTAASAAARYREETKNAQAENDNKERLTSKIVMLGVTAPTCDIVTAGKAEFDEYVNLKLREFPADKIDKAALLVQNITTLKGRCENLQAARESKERVLQPNPKVAPGGELGKAFLDLKSEEDALAKDKTDAELATAALKAAQAKYDSAEKAFQADPGAGTKKDVDDAIVKLKAWNEDAKKLQDSPFLDKLLSDVRLDALDKFLATYDAAATGKGTEAGSNRLAVALALIPDMEKKSAEALANAERPNLTPFVLRKNIEQARAEAAKREVERREAVVDLRRKIVASLEDQLDAYAGAYVASSKVPATSKKEGKDVPVRWAEALQTIDSKPDVTVPANVLEPKIAAWRASTRYLEAEGRLRSDVGQSYYRIYALQYGGVLLQAESSIQQWKGLVDPSVDLLAQWGASGVVPQDIIQLFNSLMLLGIALGVN
jgi:hypothetical protein